MGWFSNILAQKASATATPGGELSSGQAPWFMGGNRLIDLLRKAQALEGAQSAQTAVPAAPASDIQGSIRRNLALQNLNPFQYMPGGRERWGGGITGLPEYAAATQQQPLQIAAQNQAAAVPVGAVPELYRKSPKPAGPFYIGSDEMNAWLASQGIGPVMGHMGGFVHQHPLPGERILR